MRALVVVCNPNLPDIAYFSGDEEFCNNINKKAKQSGWQQEGNLSAYNQVDLNILVQYFQSLIASQQALSSMLNCPYQSLQAEDGSIIVIRQYNDHIFVAINGDGTEKEQFLLHKIFILQRMIAFLFGPNPEGLRCNNERAIQIEMWNSITRMLDTWVYLYHVEQSFLMEAVERLNVNQFLNGICIQLLEKALTSSGDRHRVHALLLVKGKLLALFSSQNAADLSPSNILMITMITETFYPSQRTFSEGSENFLKGMNVGEAGRKVGSSQFYVGEDYTSATEDNRSDNSSTYYSPNQGNSPFHSDHEEDGKPAAEGGASTSVKTPSGRPLPGSLGNSPDHYSTPKAEADVKPVKMEENPQKEEAPRRAKLSCPEEGFQLSVFLQQLNKKFVPHRLTLIPVLPGINMVIVATERRSSLGVDIIDALDLVEKVYQKRDEVIQKGPKHNLMSKLEDVVEKEIIGYMKSNKIGNKDFHDKILSSYKDFKALLNKSVSIDSFRSGTESLIKTLKNLFKGLFLQHRKLVQEILPKDLDDHLQCQKSAREKLEFYQDYLAVKGEKNLTMMTYLDKYPGLVHFIHVDRTTNQLTAPAINIDYSLDKKKSKTDAHRSLVWNFLERSRQLFQNEHTTIHFESGDFQLSSFIYFENSMGNILQTPNLPKVPREGHYPGLQAEVFFRYLTDQGFPSSSDSIRCCELHCFHLAIVPLNVVAQQARVLREYLWETCGVAAAAINLL
ncbi:BLOC-3 complex member HPS1-like [Apostichopus japonicus]|uniref:BLOC-3 complex member HPS1-like n=1 Tax=Stichopus japonicus TaxID=307972 RepID=UPI003AB4AED4